jgi:hypothetical protein
MLANTGALCGVMVMPLVACLELAVPSLTVNPTVRDPPGWGSLPDAYVTDRKNV